MEHELNASSFVALELENESFVGRARSASHPTSGVSEGLGSVIVASFSSPQPRPGSGPTLTLKLGDEAVDVVELVVRIRDIRSLVREALAPLEGQTRTQLVEFISTAAWAETRRTPQLSRSLLALREGLRERLPRIPSQDGHQRSLVVDAIVMPDDRSCYVKGWMRDDRTEIVRLTAVAPEGGRVELLERLSEQSRWDHSLASRTEVASNAGFVCYFELPTPSLLSEGWILEMENADGACVEVEAPMAMRGIEAVRNTILADLAQVQGRDEGLLEHHVFPALSRVQRRLEALATVASVEQYGDPPASPDISIVVPLYMRLEMIEHQLAEFVHDPDISASDLIYVLDSPQQSETAWRLATLLYPVYEVPFRIAVLERNVGFAGATNAGASLARGRLLVMLNSDVFPDKPGWLTSMSRFYDATPGIGALGPKLLFEDDSIQHAGMTFQRSLEAPVWIDRQYFQGLHRTLPAANVPRQVPAVTGACLMIARELFERVGGLSTAYVLGYYEDFDLCLKLNEAGLATWYLPEAELYHLEGQSYTDEMRQRCWKYNAWLQTREWDSRIQALLSEHSAL